MKNSPAWHKFIYSRKFWVFLTAFITLFFATLQDGVFDNKEIEQLTLLAVGYLGSVALEDGLSNMNPPKGDNQ